MRALSEQIAAAEMFARTARFHLDNPQPETLDQVRKDLLEALGAKEIPFEMTGFTLKPSYLWITNSAEVIEVLQRMIDEASDEAA